MREDFQFANARSVIADVTGLLVVACAAGILALALSWSKTIDRPCTLWLIAFPVLAGACLYAWHVSKRAGEMNREKWGAMVIFTPLFGAGSFIIDVFVGSSNGHYKNFVEAAAHAGSPFGFPLTVLICPVLTLIALGSWVRCLVNPAIAPGEIEA